MELRAVDERAVLVGTDSAGRQRAVDPATLALGDELTGALHEWARVAAAVRDTRSAYSADSLVSARGRQLAARVASVMGTDVRYADPFTGRTDVVAATERRAAPRGKTALALRSAAVAWRAAGAGPTPWGTGLTISVVAGFLVLLVMVSLSAALFETSVLVSLLANLVITAGLGPSVWLLGRLVVWRWVAYGVLGGLAIGWLVWLFGLLRLL